MSDHVPGWICAAMGLGAGAYTLYGWRKGRIRWKGGVEERADDPLLFWSAIVSATCWSLICTGAGIYMILW